MIVGFFKGDRSEVSKAEVAEAIATLFEIAQSTQDLATIDHQTAQVEQLPFQAFVNLPFYKR